ncbi:MAG: alcohol dehydrogenase catalytic domain-containing protein [Rhodospirillales bacterium]|nr:alcohol dehydrogenase catalytic domain-containing protein [Rhodospirillales bacterium]
MLAAVMYQQGLPTPYAESQPFHIEEVEIDGPNEGEVLVEVAAAGLCHSDLSQVAGLRKRMLPVVGGHEGAGVVREVGPGVTKVKPGDHVVMTVATGCGSCRYCVNIKPALCERISVSRSQGVLPNGMRRLSRNCEPVFHYSGISSFAQYAVTSPNALIQIDSSIRLDVAAMFGCAVVTGAGAVFNTARLRPGQSAAVIGLGGVGLNAVMAARVAGASSIIGIDLKDEKFALARELGCTHTISARDPDAVQTIKDLTRGGVDFCFEISGAKPAMTMANAITCKGGEVICVGLGATTDMYHYAHALLVGEEKAFRGSLMGGGLAERDIPMLLRLYRDGRLQVDRLMSRTMKFDELNRSLDLLDRGEVVRQILLPNG